MFIRVYLWPNLFRAVVSAEGAFPRIDSHQHFTPEYLPSLLFPILKRNRFDGSVVVASRPSVEETRWLLELAAQHDFIRAVVGWADLADPLVGATLDEFQRHPKFRGVCYWFTGELPPGLGELTRRGLSLDVGAGFTPALAKQFPDLPDRHPSCGDGNAEFCRASGGSPQPLCQGQRADHRRARPMEGRRFSTARCARRSRRSAPSA